MLKIKLSRFGKRNQPHYRIVVNEARDKRDGSYVESLGHYAPAQSPKLLELDLDRYQYWTEQGAQPTDTVAFLAEVVESGKGFPKKKKKAKSKSKTKKKKDTQKADSKKAEKSDKKKSDKTDSEQKQDKKEETKEPQDKDKSKKS